MDHSQWYIGALNGVVVCLDRRAGTEVSGRFYHSFSREPVTFFNLEQLLFRMEEFFNQLKFPYPSTNERYFEPVDMDTAEEDKRSKIMKDEELLRQHGDLGSFIVRVQHRQNSSWQGRITWMEKNQTVYFRSVWDMMKLIENALDTVCPPEDEAEEPAWPEE